MKIKDMAVKSIILAKQMSYCCGAWDADASGKKTTAKKEVETAFKTAKKDYLDLSSLIIGEDQALEYYSKGIGGTPIEKVKDIFEAPEKTKAETDKKEK